MNKVTLKLKAWDWWKKETAETHESFGWLAILKKWREAGKREKTMYNLWLFFTSFHRSFIIFCNMQLVFLFLIYSSTFDIIGEKRNFIVIGIPFL